MNEDGDEQDEESFMEAMLSKGKNRSSNIK